MKKNRRDSHFWQFVNGIPLYAVACYRSIIFFGITVLGLTTVCTNFVGATGKDALNISEEYSILDGHPKMGNVFAHGFKALFTFKHNHSSSPEILINKMKINLHSFDPRTCKELGLEYVLEGDAIFGAGPAMPGVFRVSLKGEQIGTPRWIQDSQTVLTGEIENFFQTNPPLSLNITSDSQGEVMEGIVLGRVPGKYTTSFSFGFEISGEFFEKETEPVISCYED